MANPAIIEMRSALSMCLVNIVEQQISRKKIGRNPRQSKQQKAEGFPLNPATSNMEALKIEGCPPTLSTSNMETLKIGGGGV
ncbi:MAG: hypothetical protein CMF59_10370 [Leptospiraceae bacterium]|nr:hypothetical protein [Leptospiraceae bacterium]